MCGFAGLLTSEPSTSGQLENDVTAMARAIRHRGPDDSGVWVDDTVGIALGHSRLSILDLSPAGHQPMVSNCGRYVLAFNGEIYNHLDLRRRLLDLGDTLYKDTNWRGHSDTETLLACFSVWGLAKTLTAAVGMFALALWDREAHKLILARDRFGEKPLYYGWVNSDIDSRRTFLFGSELKALRANPNFSNPVSREALAQYMRFLFVPSPMSIYEGIFKLEPGCYLTLSLPGSSLSPSSRCSPAQEITRWWGLSEVVRAGCANPIIDELDAIEELDLRLKEAVRLQSFADVAVGAFLSGGVDSSTIVALMQRQSTRAVKTFTVGFEEAGFDESPHALAVARQLGTDHTELFVTASEAREVIKQLPGMYDEPFADSSQIPTYLVCKTARQHVTVALSGDAGDEFFGGYNRYFWGPRIWRKISWMPYPIRKAFGVAISSVPVAAWDNISRSFNMLVSEAEGISRAGEKAHKLASRLASVQSIDDLYMSLVSEWQDPASVVTGAADLIPIKYDGRDEVLGLSDIHRMMYRDSVTYLPDDILCKVDRAAMSVSLETRIPFLDHRVAELAWQLPLNMKVRGDTGKWALRQVLYKYVPQELIDRPKSGFGIPVGDWLRGPLRNWAEGLLDERRLLNEGYFFPSPIRNKWIEHLSGKRDHTASLWAVLMFQAWLAHVEGRD